MNKVVNQDAMKFLASLNDKSVDIVITDPPYDLSENMRAAYHDHFMRISRSGAIVFCPPENQWYPCASAKQYLFWVKPISTKNTSRSYSRFVEMIMLYGDLKWNLGRHWSQYTNVFSDLVDGVSNHPHEKPMSMIRRLILNHTSEGDIVLDPFTGSGTVPKVAAALGRKYLACEVNVERYHAYLASL